MSSSKTPLQSAITFLARREHSEKELTQKLLAKNFSPEEIEQTLATLKQKGLQSNTRFLENFIHARRQKGIGPLRIQAELMERGIAESLIEEVLDIADNAWASVAAHVWQKRFKNKLPKDFKMRAQQMRFLQYRGFTRDQIESVFKSA